MLRLVSSLRFFDAGGLKDDKIINMNEKLHVFVVDSIMWMFQNIQQIIQTLNIYEVNRGRGEKLGLSAFKYLILVRIIFFIAQVLRTGV